MLVLENFAHKMSAAHSFASHHVARSSLRPVSRRFSGEALMTKWIGAAVMAVTLMFGGSAAVGPALAAPLQAGLQKLRASKPVDVSARRRIQHHHRYAYRSYDRPYYPAYYDRPNYYAPAPFFPFLGLGYGPWW
jgi:hypothetical protein